jgi:hypothetical protein
MAFCTNCGATVSDAFCSQCGAAVSGGIPQTPPAPDTPAAMQGTVPAKRRIGPLGWILIIVLGMFLLGMLAVVGGGFFVYHKARQAGVDPELMRSSPTLAMSKLMAAVNPDVEVLSVDEGRGLITLKQKSTGKTVTMNFEDVKRGKIVFKEEGGEGGKATMEFGASSDELPAWIPTYPGAKTEGAVAMTGDEGKGGTFHFITRDEAAKVIAFYRDGLKQGGMNVTSNESGEGGSVIGRDDAAGRTVAVTINPESGQTAVNVTFGTKK